MTDDRREAIRRVLEFVDALEAAGLQVVEPSLLDEELVGPGRATLQAESIKFDADGVDVDALQDELATQPANHQVVTTDDREDLPDDAPSPDQKWCGHCGEGFRNAQGVKIHTGQCHEEDAEILDEQPEFEPSDEHVEDDVQEEDDAPEQEEHAPRDADVEEKEELPDLDFELPDDITAEAVRSVAAAESVTSIQDAARELDLEAAATRTLLTNMGLRPQVDLDTGGEAA